MKAGEASTYPKKQGEYLIKYMECEIPYYMIAYFWPEGSVNTKGESVFGFFYDADCSKEANIETQWGYKPFAYCYLPNMIIGEKEMDYTKVECESKTVTDISLEGFVKMYVGSKNNPLTGKTFREIDEIRKEYILKSVN